MNPTHKAILIAKTIYEKKSGDNYSDCVESAIKMHEWDKEQFIKWAADWLEGVRLDYYSENIKEFIEKFKKDAEEQL